MCRDILEITRVCRDILAHKQLPHQTKYITNILHRGEITRVCRDILGITRVCGDILAHKLLPHKTKYITNILHRGEITRVCRDILGITRVCRDIIRITRVCRDILEITSTHKLLPHQMKYITNILHGGEITRDILEITRTQAPPQPDKIHHKHTGRGRDYQGYPRDY